MTPLAVIDTNVVSAGLMTRRADAPTARILDAMLDARFPFALSEALLEEYDEVLNRPALRRRHGVSSREVESLLIALASHAVVLVPAAGPPAPDRGDQHLWGLLAARHDLTLVSGDPALLEAPDAPAPVMPPEAFAAELTNTPRTR